MNFYMTKKYLLPIAFILLLTVFFQYNYFSVFPTSNHSWAQNDRYALALGFVDNGLRFFEPQTNIYNHQFPGWWQEEYQSTRTAVDFPIHDYIPAVFMKLFNRNSFLLFRIYVLLFGCIGLFFLYKLSLLLTKCSIKSFFVVAFAACSPAFVFYHAALLPTVPSVACAIIGFYFYFSYYEEERSTLNFSLALGFLTLAALSRTTFAIALIALFGIEFLNLLRKRNDIKTKIIPTISVLAVYFAYFAYNSYLNKEFGADFLSSLMPPDNFSHAKELISTAMERYKWVYFSQMHYLIFVLALAGAALYLLVKKTVKVKADYLLLVFAYLFGCLLFSLAMLKQFPNHDYYFLDSFYLPVVLLFVLLLQQLPEIASVKNKIISVLVLLCSLFFMVKASANVMAERNTAGSWSRSAITYSSYKNSAAFLDSLGVDKDARILALDVTAPNMVHNLMRRRGYTLMSTEAERIENALTFKADYIVFQNNRFMEDIYQNYPAIVHRLKKVAGNGRITLCQPVKFVEQSVEELINLSPENAKVNLSLAFPFNGDAGNWSNIKEKSNAENETKGWLPASDVFGLTYKTGNLPELSQASCMVTVRTAIQFIEKKECLLVVSLKTGDEVILYETKNLAEQSNDAGKWKEHYYQFQLPEVDAEDYEFAVYFWNTGKAELLYNNFIISVY